MGTTLTKETGAIVANANTYADLDDLAAFLSQRGSDVGDGGDANAAALINAMDWLAVEAPNWIGVQVAPGRQSLDWPRNQITADGMTTLPDDYMPQQLVFAQCAVAMAVLQGVNVLPNGDPAGFVTMEKVGPLTTTFQQIAGAGSRPSLPIARAYLKSITRGGGPLLVGRV